MNRIKSITLFSSFCLLVLASVVLPPGQARALSVKEAIGTAMDAYIYGYPLVTFDMVRRQQTNVAAPDEKSAPMGQMIRMRNYPSVDEKCCAAPNADTLYTMTWLDVSEEPWVFSIPDMGERYYIMPLLDGFSEVFMVASSLTTGGQAQSYVITGPGWSGSLPDGVNEVKSPTGIVWVLGRIYCTGTPEDYTAVHELQDKVSVLPLSAYGTSYKPLPGTVDAEFDMKTAVREQVNHMDIKTYFNYLAQLLKKNPPTPEDAEIVKRMAEIGLIPGQDFDSSKLGFIDSTLLDTVPKLSLLEMGLYLKKQKTTNGWLYFTSGVGNFGTNYLLRGMANLLGPGWNRPQDAVYPLSEKDADGDKYDGAKNNYKIHFEKGQLPPVEAFWSLTMYDPKFFFVPNTINRYELSERNKFISNPDGSVDFYLQAKSPGREKEANWLPTPEGKFVLVLRLYGPPKKAPTILNGSWTPPPVKRMK